MKTTLAILLLCASASLRLQAQPVPVPVPPNHQLQRVLNLPLAWDIPTNYVDAPVPLPPANIIHYKLYRGTNAGVYVESVLLPGGTNTFYRWNGLPPGTSNYFAVTAVNRDGVESDRSPVYLRQTDPVIAAPRMLIPLTNSLQAANSPGGPWETLATQVLWAVADQPERTFRTVLEKGQPIVAVK